MFIRQFQIEGLGHLSTLIGDEEAGLAAVVDPRRDIDIYVDAARESGLRISHVIETHLHNDYVSGGRELAAATGAEQVIGAGAGLAYEHRPVQDGEIATVGGLKFRVLDTPGHTPGHHSLLVNLKEKGPVILSGDMAHFHENYDANGVPGFNFDRAQTLASLERIRKIAANLKATVIIQHDVRDIGKLPAFPAAAR